MKSLELMEVDWHGLDLIKIEKSQEWSDPNQRTLVVNNKRSVGLSSGKLSLTTEELIQKAEKIQALKFVDANYSYPSS